MLEKLNDKSVNKGLHWTTIASEKALLPYRLARTSLALGGK